MGWGEPLQPLEPRPVPHRVARAAKELADAVKRWSVHRSCNNEEKMLLALEEYDRAVNSPW